MVSYLKPISADGKKKKKMMMKKCFSSANLPLGSSISGVVCAAAVYTLQPAAFNFQRTVAPLTGAVAACDVGRCHLNQPLHSGELHQS